MPTTGEPREVRIENRYWKTVKMEKDALLLTIGFQWFTSVARSEFPHIKCPVFHRVAMNYSAEDRRSLPFLIRIENRDDKVEPVPSSS